MGRGSRNQDNDTTQDKHKARTNYKIVHCIDSKLSKPQGFSDTVVENSAKAVLPLWDSDSLRA
jgi:hypothetical protein